MTPPRNLGLIGALGIAQIFAWGASYYLPSVFLAAIAADTGWSPAMIVGGLTSAMMVSGLASPKMGRMIGTGSPRQTLALGAVTLALGLAIISQAHSLAVYYGGWLILGLGMALGLYDASFATLGRILGPKAKQAIVGLTLIGGFASTVCWPLSQFLMGMVGWRGAILAYAGIMLLICLPLYLLAVPSRGYEAQADAEPAPSPPAAPPHTAHPAAHPAALPAWVFYGVAGFFSIQGALTTTFLIHILWLLPQLDSALDTNGAIALAAMIGPAQVASRLLQFGVGQRLHPIHTMLIALALILAGVTLIFLGDATVIAVALIAYGAGNGLQTIARGTMPLALFGPVGYAQRIGKMALPSQWLQAVAPTLAVWVLGKTDAHLWMLVLLVGFGVNLALLLAIRQADRRARRPAAAQTGAVPPVS